MIDVDKIEWGVMPEPRTKPLAESVPSDVYTAVWQAVGAASVCWDKTPHGVFDTTKAEAVAVNLLHVIGDAFAGVHGVDRTTDFDARGGCSMTNLNQTKNYSGAELIAAERQRQIEAEGWTPEHDDSHTLGELAAAGACYALLETRWRDSSILNFGSLVRSILWPWEDQWFKPAQYELDRKDHDVFIRKSIKNLTRAGALIAAEIDRLQRKEAR